MTNEEFITAKRKSKFDLIWDSLINRLPKSSKSALEKNSCAFNSKHIRKEQCIECRRIGLKDSNRIYSDKTYINKNDLAQMFLDYQSYLTEIREYRFRAQERIDNGLEFFQPDIDRLKITFEKEYRRLKNEQRYAEALIKIGGGSIKTENTIDKLSLNSISHFIKEHREKRKFSYIYFEFKEYGIEKISQLIWRKYKVEDILIEQKVSQFVEFCKKQKVIDIYDLILIPYYSKSLLREFGAECLQAVINSIRAFIDLQTFDYTTISFEDLE